MDSEAYMKLLEMQIREQTAQREKAGLGPHITEIHARKLLERVRESQESDEHKTLLDGLPDKEREKLMEAVAGMTDEINGAALNLAEKHWARFSSNDDQAVLQNETRASLPNQEITNSARDFAVSGVGLATAVVIGGVLVYEKVFGKDKINADNYGPEQTTKDQTIEDRASKQLRELEERQLKMRQSQRPKL